MTNRQPFGDRMANYVEVADRIQAFYEKYPEGSLQSEIYHLDAEIVVMKAWAYRTPDDPRPGMGWSSMLIPGATPYTKGSEIENTETSAWGRAIAALGFEVRRGIASRDEIANKRDQRQWLPERDVDADRNVAPMQPRRAVAGSVDAPAGTFANGGQLLTAALNELHMNRAEALIVLGVDSIAEVEDYPAAWATLSAQAGAQ